MVYTNQNLGASNENACDSDIANQKFLQELSQMAKRENSWLLISINL